MKFKKKTKNIELYNVYILPNNQPAIKLGQYYAIDTSAAMEMAAIDNQISVDENWGAELANIEK